MPIRPLRNLYAFGPKLLVACPDCSEKALLSNRGRSDETHIVLTCSCCKLKQRWQEPSNQILLMGVWRRVRSEGGPSVFLSAPAGYGGSAVGVWVETSPDSTQKSESVPLQLWLQKPCGQESLWFLNAEHLLWTKSRLHVSDDPRPRLYDTKSRRQKRLWLPDWVELPENREAILDCLEVMELDI